MISHPPVFHALIEEENKRRAEAVAWVKKYFVVASIARGWRVLAIRGIIASVLNSRPTQARSQWWLIRVVVVPIAKLRISTDSVRGFISKGWI